MDAACLSTNYQLPFLIQSARNAGHLQLSDRLRDLNIARAGHGAVVNRVTARQPVCLCDDVHPFGSSFIAAVKDEALCSHERGGTKIFITAPVGWAGGRAGRT